VDDVRLRWQLEKLIPGPADRLPDQPLDGEAPLIESNPGGRPGREHWPIIDQVLAGRDAAGLLRLTAPAEEPSRNEPLPHNSSNHRPKSRRRVWVRSDFRPRRTLGECEARRDRHAVAQRIERDAIFLGAPQEALGALTPDVV